MDVTSKGASEVTSEARRGATKMDNYPIIRTLETKPSVVFFNTLKN